jgi:hypothetical protein
MPRKYFSHIPSSAALRPMHLLTNIHYRFMADRGTYVRTASPRRRLSITDMFVKKGAQGRRSSLGVGAWSPKNSAEIMDLDDGFLADENGLCVITEECN